MRQLRIHNFFLLYLFCVFNVFSQEYPDEILGYKVHKTQVKVADESSENFDVKAEFGEPKLSKIGLTGIYLEFPAKIFSDKQSAKIDFIKFENFYVNNVKVDIKDFRKPFKLSKQTEIILPEKIKVFVSFPNALKTGLKDLKESKEDWQVTGSVLVFGKFRKFMMNFKRVVPVEINLKIKNPLRD